MANWEFVRALKKRWGGGVVAGVPVDIELCEFGCRKPGCSHAEFENCEPRKQFVEAAEKEAGHSKG